ncbi:redoxin domain-containing protein [Verrucomicrobiaceae bacterium N1E253]|uniref:Redoxin domain-containing protein n=1 Tax=Oceaniferula marina TaxID=2748318 RepID=A0A851GQU0_9BACT|nr:redoxin domain-containing protein [Oceaniferula marina]NWK57180.1 redoxin domain-containing protein [Oceaniferula marina]
MSIQIGDQAPDFSLVSQTADGPQVIALSDLTADSHVLLLFVPMAFTGGCTAEFCSITKSLDAYTALDAKVVGISGDNPFAQEAWAKKEGIGLTLLSDYEHEVSEAYGVAYESFIPEANLIMGGVSKRSAFVVDKGGVVRYAEVLDNPHDMPDFDAIQACLKAL